ncbi:hypothetical protein BKA57DRAFT_539986, partial [Linnemannia elongata]
MSLQKLQNEAITLRPLPHTNIVAYISHSRFQEPLHLVLELASHERGQLADLGEMKDRIKCTQKPNGMVVAESFQVPSVTIKGGFVQRVDFFFFFYF